MRNERKLTSFDWAMKQLLRNKASFASFEGFLSELLMDDVTIKSLLESESNRETRDDRSNRVWTRILFAKLQAWIKMKSRTFFKTLIPTQKSMNTGIMII